MKTVSFQKLHSKLRHKRVFWCSNYSMCLNDEFLTENWLTIAQTFIFNHFETKVSFINLTLEPFREIECEPNYWYASKLVIHLFFHFFFQFSPDSHLHSNLPTLSLVWALNKNKPPGAQAKLSAFFFLREVGISLKDKG